MCDSCFMKGWCDTGHSSCPCEEDKPVKCDMCGQVIYEDERAYEIYGDIICESCIDNARGGIEGGRYVKDKF